MNPDRALELAFRWLLQVTASLWIAWAWVGARDLAKLTGRVGWLLVIGGFWQLWMGDGTFALLLFVGAWGCWWLQGRLPGLPLDDVLRGRGGRDDGESFAAGFRRGYAEADDGDD